METGPLKMGVAPVVEMSCWPADCRQASGNTARMYTAWLCKLSLFSPLDEGK